MILTDRQGRPFERPVRRHDEPAVDYLRRVWAFNDVVTACANDAFARAFRPGTAVALLAPPASAQVSPAKTQRDRGPRGAILPGMNANSSKGIAVESAAYFDRELVALLSDGCGHVVGSKEKKMLAAVRRAAKAGRVRVTKLEHDGYAVKAV